MAESTSSESRPGSRGASGKLLLSDELIGHVQQALLSEPPDVSRLDAELQAEFDLAPDEIVSLTYQIALRLNLALFPPVTKLELIHTEGCNLACSYCFERNMISCRRMPLAIAEAAVDLLFDYSGDRRDISITHFGGEPTLNFTAIQAVTGYAERKALVAGKTVHFDMTSNGTLINEGMARYCADHGIMILLSMDGLQATHDRFRRDRRGHGSFERVMRGFQVLKRFQAWVGVKITVMPENVATLYNDVLGLHEIGVNQFLIGGATGVVWRKEETETFSEQFGRLFRWYKQSSGGDLRIKDFEGLETLELPYFGCQAARDNITVHVTGEVSPCAKVLALNHQQLISKLGDVRHGLTHLHNRAELVHCDKLKASCDRKQISDRFRGGCWAENFEENGDVNEPSLQGHQLSILQHSVCSG